MRKTDDEPLNKVLWYFLKKKKKRTEDHLAGYTANQ